MTLSAWSYIRLEIKLFINVFITPFSWFIFPAEFFWWSESSKKHEDEERSSLSLSIAYRPSYKYLFLHDPVLRCCIFLQLFIEKNWIQGRFFKSSLDISLWFAFSLWTHWRFGKISRSFANDWKYDLSFWCIKDIATTSRLLFFHLHELQSQLNYPYSPILKFINYFFCGYVIFVSRETTI